jgi:chorismate mutase
VFDLVLIEWIDVLIVESDLDELRKEIQQITLEIMNLAGRRLQLSKEIGEIKNKQGIPIENLEIEKQLKQAVVKACKEFGFSVDFFIELTDLLVSQAKRIQLNNADC